MGVLHIIHHAQHRGERQVCALVDLQQVDRQRVLLELQLILYVDVADHIGKHQRDNR